LGRRLAERFGLFVFVLVDSYQSSGVIVFVVMGTGGTVKIGFSVVAGLDILSVFLTSVVVPLTVNEAQKRWWHDMMMMIDWARKNNRKQG
jgi:hypothetical protein